MRVSVTFLLSSLRRSDEPHAEPAERAGGMMRYSVLRVASPDMVAKAPELAAGRFLVGAEHSHLFAGRPPTRRTVRFLVPSRRPRRPCLSPGRRSLSPAPHSNMKISR